MPRHRHRIAYQHHGAGQRRRQGRGLRVRCRSWARDCRGPVADHRRSGRAFDVRCPHRQFVRPRCDRQCLCAKHAHRRRHRGCRPLSCSDTTNPDVRCLQCPPRCNVRDENRLRSLSKSYGTESTLVSYGTPVSAIVCRPESKLPSGVTDHGPGPHTLVSRIVTRRSPNEGRSTGSGAASTGDRLSGRAQSPEIGGHRNISRIAQRNFHPPPVDGIDDAVDQLQLVEVIDPAL